ncbi:hypothetical protein C8F04DRAFT_1257559 [Mycena alexandri]|uniref:Uncharacterized protein n=1 Tax=Mycena alexandri TaxID=1745969 RepID=A0AAD6T0Q7_9AGAR|nr:hypothetical protein C8F04DRAFT_1257559 [Mycena alexandri]
MAGSLAKVVGNSDFERQTPRDTHPIRRSLFCTNPAAPAAMSGLPDALRIPDGPEKLSLPPNSLSVSGLIEFQLPPQRKSTVYVDPSDYLSELPPTITTFDVREIVRNWRFGKSWDLRGVFNCTQRARAKIEVLEHFWAIL